MACVALGKLMAWVLPDLGIESQAWPAVGVGVVTVYALGRQFLPAYFAATLVLLAPLAAGSGWPLVVLLAAAYAGHAAFGAWLLHRVVGADAPIVTPREIVAFQLITGPLHAVLAATVWAGVHASDEPASAWLRWWAADSAGGILFAPLIAVAVGKPRSLWSPRAVTVAVPLVAALCVGVVALWYTDGYEQRVVDRKLADSLNSVAAEFAAEVRPVEVAAGRLQRGKSPPPHDPRSWPGGAAERVKEFAEFVPAGRAWAIARISDDERRQFEARPASGVAPVAIVRRDPDGSFRPSPRRAHYDVLTAVEPPSPSYPVGLEFAGEPEWFDLIAEATWNSRPAFGNLTADQAVRFVAPCLDPTGADAGGCIAATWEATGFVSRFAEQGLELRLTVDGDLAGAGGHSVPVSFLGRRFGILATTSPNYYAAHRPGAVWVVALVVVCALLVMAKTLLFATGQTVVVTREIEERTRELRREVQNREDVERFLRQSEQWLSEAQRIARVGYWEWRADSDELLWSTVMTDLLGLPGSDVRLRLDDFLGRVYPDDRPTVRRLIEGMPATAHSVDVEFRVIRHDGTVRWFTSTVTNMTAGPDAQTGVIRGTALDVTERKRAELALREGETRLRLALQSAHMGTWEWIVGTQDLYWDLRTEAIFGFSPGSFNRTLAAFRGLIHPDDRQGVEEILAGTTAGVDKFDIEFRIVLPDGETRWIAGHGQLLAHAGRRARLVGINYDITEKKQADERVLAAKQRLKEAQAIAGVGSFEWRPGSPDVYWSEEMYRLLDYDQTDPASFESFLARVHPDDRAAVEANYHSALNGLPYSHELRLLLPSGEVRHVLSTARIARAADGSVALVRGINQDITERTREAQERQQFQKQLTESQRLESLGVLAGGIAHDFNNLLTGILGNASLARELVPPGGELHEYLRPIEKSAEHAAHLCQQMLTYAGANQSVRGALDLDNVIRESDDLLKLCVSRRADFRLELHQALPPIDGDAGQIRQVLLNLVQNASEALHESGGRVTARTGHADEYPPLPAVDTSVYGTPPDGPTVWMEVEDTGTGMSEATRQRIFEPFFTTKFTGRGLGLSAVVGIVRAHNGCLAVTSRLGVGTTFHVAFPQAARVSTADETGAERTPFQIPWDAAVRRTALIAEDDPTVSAVVGYALKGLGFTLDATATGAEAVARFTEDPRRYDIAVLDLIMPDGDGRKVLDVLRQSRPELPVILMSGYTEHQFADLDFGGALTFLHKPFRAVDLSAAVRRVLSRSGVTSI